MFVNRKKDTLTSFGKLLCSAVLTALGIYLLWSFFLSSSQPVAFVITITSLDANYLDGAAVLSHSIEMNIHYPYLLVAIVHDSVSAAGDVFLARSGYRIFRVSLPVPLSEIPPHLREAIEKGGCCGAKELIKLEVFRLNQYLDVSIGAVVLLDTDTLITKPNAMAELVDDMALSERAIKFSYDRSSKQVDFPHGERKGYSCASGGFLIGRPSLVLYDYFCDLLKEGEWDPEKGWKRDGIGLCWGGESFTGLFSLFVHTHADRVQEVDACRVNALDKNSNTDGEQCKEVAPSSIELFHFELKNKPWRCESFTYSLPPDIDSVDLKQMKEGTVMDAMQSRWWSYRNAIVTSWHLALPLQEGCYNEQYLSLMTAFNKKLGQDSKRIEVLDSDFQRAAVH